MPANLTIQLNGQPRLVENIDHPSTLDVVVIALELKADRIAVELNGDIVRRSVWVETIVRDGDKLEIVHFVGGGLA